MMATGKKNASRSKSLRSNELGSFRERVLATVRDIPAGETRSYQEVAGLAGQPRAARAVGTIMRTNFDPAVPCHRVIRADGRLGGYNRGGERRKNQLLAQERRAARATGQAWK